MASFNKIIFMGHVTADPMVKAVGSSTVANFTVANNRKSKKKDGTVVEEVCFLGVEAWGQTADIIVKFLKKGSPVLVEGRLKQNSWQDKDGKERTKHVLFAESVVLMGTKQDGDDASNNTQVDNKVAQPIQRSPQVVSKIAQQLNNAGFEVTRVDSQPKKAQENIDDLPF